MKLRAVRRKAREFALMLLYQQELSEEEGDHLLQEFWKERKAMDEVKEYAEKLFKGVLRNRDMLDSLLKKHARKINFDRLVPIDKNILRIAAYEMLFVDDVTPAIAIDEAIEISKIYSEENSYVFINAILDSLRKEELKKGESDGGEESKGGEA